MNARENLTMDVLDFLERVDDLKISREITTVRPNALMVTFRVPGQYVEVDFFTDGTIEVETFESKGVVPGTKLLLDEILDRESLD